MLGCRVPQVCVAIMAQWWELVVSSCPRFMGRPDCCHHWWWVLSFPLLSCVTILLSNSRLQGHLALANYWRTHWLSAASLLSCWTLNPSIRRIVRRRFDAIPSHTLITVWIWVDNITYYKCDVSKWEEVEAVQKRIVEEVLLICLYWQRHP